MTPIEAVEPREKFRQVTRGRSSLATLYRKIVRWVPSLSCARDEIALSKSEVMDGIPSPKNCRCDPPRKGEANSKAVSRGVAFVAFVASLCKAMKSL